VGPTPYTDPDTGIVFQSWTNNAGTLKFGYTYPANAATVAATEFIGVLVGTHTPFIFFLYLT
jgi:hypothetical protein